MIFVGTGEVVRSLRRGSVRRQPPGRNVGRAEAPAEYGGGLGQATVCGPSETLEAPILADFQFLPRLRFEKAGPSVTGPKTAKIYNSNDNFRRGVTAIKFNVDFCGNRGGRQEPSQGVCKAAASRQEGRKGGSPRRIRRGARAGHGLWPLRNT